MEISPRDLLKGYVEVSSLPMIHLRLEEAINNQNKSMSDIAKVIREDPGLTARLLRIVNSAFYNFPSKIETISQAVTIVGTQQLSALALATSVMKMFKGLPQNLVSMDSFWRHSIACGLAARMIGSFRRETKPERFFVAGMLHDIGRLIMYTKIPDPVARDPRHGREVADPAVRRRAGEARLHACGGRWHPAADMETADEPGRDRDVSSQPEGSDAVSDGDRHGACRGYHRALHGPREQRRGVHSAARQ